MLTRGISQFMARDWRWVRESKDTYWSQRIHELGPSEAFRIADELRRQAIEIDPGWPATDDRRRDLSAHVFLAELMRRARPARSD
jgi:hypothetical protein